MTDLTLQFYHPDAVIWQNALRKQDSDSVLNCIRNGRDAWIINTYIMLSKTSIPIDLVDNFEDPGIYVCHYDDLPKKGYPITHFFIAVRADRDRAFLCDMEIVQSPSSIEHRNAHYVPHWTQPNLKSRDVRRGTSIYSLGYFGESKNLAVRFQSASFRDALSSLGVTLKIHENPDSWSDYSDIDLVLAVRDGSDYFLASKPATKLFNAWLAGVPIITGAEPAYSYYWLSPLDFICTGNVDEVLEAISDLKNNPDRYQKMIANGFERAREIDRKATTRHWISIVQNYAYPAYQRKKRNSFGFKRILHAGKQRFMRFRRTLRGSLYVRGVAADGYTKVRGRNPLRKIARFIELKLLSIFD